MHLKFWLINKLCYREALPIDQEENLHFCTQSEPNHNKVKLWGGCLHGLVLFYLFSPNLWLGHFSALHGSIAFSQAGKKGAEAQVWLPNPTQLSAQAPQPCGPWKTGESPGAIDDGPALLSHGSWCLQRGKQRGHSLNESLYGPDTVLGIFLLQWTSRLTLIFLYREVRLFAQEQIVRKR